MSTISGVSNMREAAMPQAKSGVNKPISPQQKISNLFQQIDTAGKGSITKTQFEQAFKNMNPPDAVKAIGVEAAFSKLDPSGTGSVSKAEFIKGMESLMAQGPTKVAAAKVVAAPTPQVQAVNSSPAQAPANTPAPVASVANGAIGNTINISA